MIGLVRRVKGDSLIANIVDLCFIATRNIKANRYIFKKNLQHIQYSALALKRRFVFIWSSEIFNKAGSIQNRQGIKCICDVVCNLPKQS